MPRVSSKTYLKTREESAAGQSPATASSSDVAAPFWSKDNDRLLIKAREQGLHWDVIASTHFPSKTGNACRKRYERLQERKRASESEWTGPRFDRLVVGYMAARKQMWQSLAAELGEEWHVIELQMINKGMKAVLAPQRVVIKRRRTDDDEDDSGLGLDLKSEGLNDVEGCRDDITTNNVPALLSSDPIASTSETTHSLPSLTSSLPPVSGMGWYPPELRALQFPPPPPPTPNDFRSIYTGPPIPPIQAPCWQNGDPLAYSSYQASTYDLPLSYGSFRAY